MNEAEPHQVDSNGEIRLPSELRIAQRLGMIGLSESVHDLVPRIQKLAGRTISPSDLIVTLDHELTEAAEAIGFINASTLSEKYMPRFIHSLVEDPEHKEATYDIWAEIIKNRKEAAETLEKARKPKSSRRQKKILKSRSLQQSRSARDHDD
jgi:hypothetical protein